MKLGSVACVCALLMACSSGAAPPAITGLTITSPTSGSTVSSSPITVLGKAPPNSRIVQDISLASDQETIAGSAGTWSLSVQLDSGSNVLTFRIGDDKTTAQSITVTLGQSVPPTLNPNASPATNPPGPAVTPAPVTGTFAQLTRRQFSQLVKAPDDHIGEQYVVWACITQFDAATGPDTFRGDASYQKEDYWFNGENSYFNGYEEDLADYVADDVAKMSVRVLGSITYETTIGGSVTVPSFFVAAIEHKGSCE